MLIEELVPRSVAAFETREYVAETLYPAEVAYIGSATNKRRNEFTTVRYCARKALQALGSERLEMVPGRHGEPVWPDGMVGSMTHCAKYCAAAVGSSRDITAIGIDAEPNRPLTRDVRSIVASSEEVVNIQDMNKLNPTISFDRLLFCVKECVYKVWYPLHKSWLNFKDVSVVLDNNGTFMVRMLDRNVVGQGYYEGRWGVAWDTLVAVLVVPSHVE